MIFEILTFLLAIVVAMLVWFVFAQRRELILSRDETRRARDEREAAIELMDSIGERMTRRIDLEDTLKVIANYVVGATSAESSAIFLYNEEDQTLQARVVIGLFPPLLEDGRIPSRENYRPEFMNREKIPLGSGLIGKVAQGEEPLLIAEAEADARVPESIHREFDVDSLLLCPMRVRSRMLGVIGIANKKGSGVFTARDKTLLLGLADQAAVAVDLVKLYDYVDEQRRLEHELSIAQDFQNMLLPRSLPEISDYEFGALNKTALVVGGDFFDFFLIDHDHLAVVIGDVSGKGVPGALIMAMVRSVIRAEARDTFSPKEVLRRVNEGVRSDTKESVFVTLTYGILDLHTNRFRFARAGHEPTLLRRAGMNGSGDDHVEVYKPEGVAAGLLDSEIFSRIEEVEVQLSPGDMVLLYTDGANEAINPAREEYGRERMIGLLKEKANRPPGQFLKLLRDDIQNFSKGIPQQDDITLVALRYNPRGHGAQAETFIEEKHPIDERELTAAGIRTNGHP